MTINDIIMQSNNLTYDDITAEEYIAKVKGNKPTISSSDKKLFSKIISDYRKHGAECILRYIIIFSFWEPDEAVAIARKKGVFRYKTWGFKSNEALFLIDKLLKYSDELKYSDKTKSFLNTKQSLAWMFDYYRKIELKIKNLMIKHHNQRKKYVVGKAVVEEALFKELLVYLGIAFYENRSESAYALEKNKLTSYSIEEIADSVSYLIFLYDDIIGIKNNISYTVSSDFVLSKEIKELILLGCKIYQIQEWEICVDYFGYSAKKVDSTTYCIYDSTTRFEKSVKLGYIKQNMSENNYRIKHITNQPQMNYSINELGSIIKDYVGNELISERKDCWIPRYVYQIPPEVFFAIKKCFGDILFDEEKFEISYFSHEMITKYEDIIEKRITDNCTIKDILLFKRLFYVFATIIEKTLLKQKDKKKMIHSLNHFMRKEELISLLKFFLDNEQKSNELLDLFTYRKDVKLDLQYTPLLETTNGISFSPFFISKCNLLRNSISYSYLSHNKIVNQDDKESLVSVCSDVFSGEHPEYKVYTNRKFCYQKQNGEIDVLVVSEKDIIIIECKSPLLPTSNFELRASVDHINKAARQLDLSKAALQDVAFRKNFLKNLGVDDANRNILTCIVFGNRLFNGYNIDGHPIRYIYELDMALNSGQIKSDFGIWRVWDNDDYTHNDLIRFLKQDYEVGKSHFSAMEKKEMFIYADGIRLFYETYALNVKSLYKRFDEQFTIVDAKEENRRKSPFFDNDD